MDKDLLEHTKTRTAAEAMTKVPETANMDA
jgi:hypothetical protein